MLNGTIRSTGGRPEPMIIGGMARRAGRLGAGHACWLAQINSAGVHTSQAHEIQAVLTKQWPIAHQRPPGG